MAFKSIYAPRIWDRLYDVRIPDQITLSAYHVKRFGTYSSGNKDVDAMMANNFTHVKICIARILEYYEDGIEIQILSREDMITMHKDIELYLGEWKEHLTYQINTDLEENKKFLDSLEKLSKYIYEKAKPKEILTHLFRQKQFGLMNPAAQIEQERKEYAKPQYDGISKLIKPRPNRGNERF